MQILTSFEKRVFVQKSGRYKSECSVLSQMRTGFSHLRAQLFITDKGLSAHLHLFNPAATFC